MDFTISPEEQKILLGDARESIASKLEGRQPRYSQDAAKSKTLQEPCGAFVTLHKLDTGGDDSEGRSLRGCIGSMTADFP